MMPAMPRRELLLKGVMFDVARVAFDAPDGTEVVREIIEHPGAAVILPVLDDGRVVLIRNVRRTVGKTLWELPAGTLEPEEAPDRCAARELEEETGYRAKSVTPLIAFFASPGVLNERMHGYLATGLTKTKQHLDADEEIEVFPLPSWEIRDMLKAGHIEDGKTIALLLYWMHVHGP